MAENILFFTLGVLVAIFVTLLIAPTIWRRAVTLTRQRIEANVPLSIEELQGERDQLRASFAAEQRKLEVTLEGERENAAQQFVKLNRAQDTILTLEDDLSARNARIEELDALAASLQTDLNNREEDLQKTEAKLLSTRRRFEDSEEALKALRNEHEDLKDDLDTQIIEVKSTMVRLEAARERERELAERLKERVAEGSKFSSEIKAQQAVIDREKTRLKRAEDRVAQLQATNADLEEKVARRDARIAKLQEGSDTVSPRVVSDATSNLNDRTEQLSAENQQLKAELAKAQSSENAIMRERIADLAAQLAAHTASSEGADSPVIKAIETPDPVVNGEAPSLAERIRDMQKAAQ
ncbi:MAG: hypothetical protein OXR62_12960 [Ahrensia sp.]|nr:hypothetical protein [Ahrensia sp.]